MFVRSGPMNNDPGRTAPMTARITSGLLAAAILVATTGPSAAKPGASASAELRTAAGEPRASAVLTERKDGVNVEATATGMAPGAYAIHLHESGRCDAPDFTTAGAHWNPMMKAHGFETEGGAHAGDLPNLEIGANGRGRINYLVKGAAIAGGASAVLDADGAAVVIHAKPDDYRSQPSGAAGERIACGVVIPAGR